MDSIYPEYLLYYLGIYAIGAFSFPFLVHITLKKLEIFLSTIVKVFIISLPYIAPIFGCFENKFLGMIGAFIIAGCAIIELFCIGLLLLNKSKNSKY